jgi:hypothetical protein
MGLRAPCGQDYPGFRRNDVRLSDEFTQLRAPLLGTERIDCIQDAARVDRMVGTVWCNGEQVSATSTAYTVPSAATTGLTSEQGAFNFDPPLQMQLRLRSAIGPTATSAFIAPLFYRPVVPPARR